MAVLFTIFSPALATLVYRIPMKGKYWYSVSVVGLYLVTRYLAYNPVKATNVTPWLHYYGISLMVLLLGFGYRYKFTRFNQAIAYSVLIIFIAGDWWEIPIFVFDYLGKIKVFTNRWYGTELNVYWWFSHVRRLYTAVTFILFQRLSHFQLRIKSLVLFGFLTFLSVLILTPIGMGNGEMLYRSATVCRLLSLFAWSILAFEGTNHVV